MKLKDILIATAAIGIGTGIVFGLGVTNGWFLATTLLNAAFFSLAISATIVAIGLIAYHRPPVVMGLFRPVGRVFRGPHVGVAHPVAPAHVVAPQPHVNFRKTSEVREARTFTPSHNNNPRALRQPTAQHRPSSTPTHRPHR